MRRRRGISRYRTQRLATRRQRCLAGDSRDSQESSEASRVGFRVCLEVRIACHSTRRTALKTVQFSELIAAATPLRGRFRSATGLNRGMAGRRKGGAPRGPDAVRVTRWLRTAFEAHGAGKLREAERLARRVLGAIPDQPDALHLLATVARESGRTDLAIDLYERLLRRHPAIPIAQNNLGQHASGARENGSARSRATRPPSPTTATTCPRTSTSGAHCCMSTISSGPNPACARRQRSRLTTRRFGRRWPALSSSRERRRRRSRRSAARSTRARLDRPSQNDAGVVHGTVGDFDTARDHFRSALALDPGNAKAALNLAKTKRFTAHHDEDADLIRAAARHPASIHERAARPGPGARQDSRRSRRVGGRVRALRKS